MSEDKIVYIDTFIDRDWADEVFEDWMEAIGREPEWVIQEASIKHLDHKSVIRIMAVKRQGELDFGDGSG